ncbi:MAG: response regulator [Treponema sp.]|jgi:DNA-binding response OmpR family regulator|nr:response regulator [Treponema sp.]
MKEVLIIDQSIFLRDFLRMKLGENDVEVTTASGDLEAISKIRNGAYDLVILDYHLGGHGYMEILKQKKANPNTRNIPVFLFVQRIEQREVIDLLPYNVKKVFSRPIHIDALFASMAEFLKIDFKNMDKHPCTAEAHVNDDIVFLEISQGLNRDKLDLLHFKIAELLNLYEIRVPKIIVMLSGMKLSFADTPNIQKLLEIIVQSCKGKSRFMRVLTRDGFVKKYIEDQKLEYGQIQTVPSLMAALEGLITDLGKGDEDQDAEIIWNRILSVKEPGPAGESLGLRYNAAKFHPKKLDLETLKESIRHSKIAVVDNDLAIQELLTNTFQRIGLKVSVFSSGEEFLETVKDAAPFDLVFLDLVLPKIDGFGVLEFLNTASSASPIIILSAVTQRESVIRAFKMGIKSYLTKPIKPADIFRKAMEILNPDF